MTNKQSASAVPRLMLVTNDLSVSLGGGRELLSRLNFKALKEIYGNDLVVFQLARKELRGLQSIAGAFRGEIDGLDDHVINNALTTMQVAGANRLFVDGSNLGALVKAAKQRYPYVEVVTFCHNVEAQFFLGAVKHTKSLRTFGVLIANYLAERKAVRNSDKIVCLSERDSRLLQRLYGHAATHICPMALQDKLPTNQDLSVSDKVKKFALFVGGAFYANMAGIDWYCRNVAAQVPIRTVVIGKGMAAIKERLERHGNVTVIGEVDDLVPWYLGAHVVVAPIFDGSGMKTKVAEALMFGKRVIGTPEAFSGYEDVAAVAGVTCTDADQFRQALLSEMGRPSAVIDRRLRRLYEDHYSYEAASLRLQAMMDVQLPGKSGDY